MKNDKFTALMEQTMDHLLDLRRTKGAEYAGNDDALSNFKRLAASMDVQPELIWAVYAGKHWDAIMSYCRRVNADPESAGVTLSEPIEGRVHDLLVYGFLLLGLIHDRENGAI